jgi:hypothetical protein
MEKLAAMVHDVAQEEEPIKIVPYEIVDHEKVESRDSEQAE